MVNEDSLTVTFHGSSKTTFRVKPHGHLTLGTSKIASDVSTAASQVTLKDTSKTVSEIGYTNTSLSPKSLLGEANFKVPTRVKNSSSICYCFRDHLLKLRIVIRRSVRIALWSPTLTIVQNDL